MFENDIPKIQNCMTISKFSIMIVVLACINFSACTNPNPENQVVKQNSDSTTSTTSEKRRKVLLFFGNSLTAGYGLESHQSFPSLIQAKLDSLLYDYEVINAGVSGETTATGSNRVSWVVERQPVDVFVLELGANDGLRGVPVEETKKNLGIIIDKVRDVHPDVKIFLAGMMIPPSMGPEYSKAFNSIFFEVAENKKVTLIPFLLDHVAGIDSLNLPDGIHPNVAGQKIVTENIWEILKNEL